MEDRPAEGAAESPFKGKTGLQRLLNATRYSLHGFASAFRHEDAFRQEVLLAAILIPIALVLDVGGAGKAMMIASVLLVLIVVPGFTLLYTLDQKSLLPEEGVD